MSGNVIRDATGHAFLCCQFSGGLSHRVQCRQREIQQIADAVGRVYRGTDDLLHVRILSGSERMLTCCGETHRIHHLFSFDHCVDIHDLAVVVFNQHLWCIARGPNNDRWTHTRPVSYLVSLCE